ncbi:hypothetical protein R0J90_18570, partial [Micrococcus sp. SIMBA_144]
KKFQKHIVSIDEKAEFRLYHRSWQGNVRELEHVIQSAMNFAEGDILVEKDFPMLLSEPMREMVQSLPEILLKTEADLIQQAMKNCL